MDCVDVQPAPRKKRKTSAKKKHKTEKVHISDENPVYCRLPIVFGGKTLFTRQETSAETGNSVLPIATPRVTVLHRLTPTAKWEEHIDKTSLENTRKLSQTSCCWHCTYPFDNPSVSLPISQLKNGKFLCHGVFCSFECTKTYNLDTLGLKFRRIDFLNKLARLTFKKHCHINCAPARNTLKRFGGTLEIDEFRQSFLEVAEERVNGLYDSVRITQKTPCNEIF